MASKRKQKSHGPRLVRGWEIQFSTWRGRPLFVAKQAGVSMNTDTYDGIVHMIHVKEFQRQQQRRRGFGGNRTP